MNRRSFILTSVCAFMMPESNVSALEVNNKYDIDFNGKKDSSDEFQRLITDAEGIATTVQNGQQKIPVYIHGIIRLSKPITINASKICLIGPATIIFSETITVERSAISLISVGESNSAYTNCVGSFLDSINFYCEKNVDLFFVENKGKSNNNPVCLLNISRCRFTGFGKIFQNGTGGWGWSWNNCGFDQCQYLLYLTPADDSYERFTFFGCIWQNGGVAFYLDNPNGKIYWDSGSFDYCEGIAHIKNGHVSVGGHLEFKNRKTPAVIVDGEYSSFLFHNGSIFISKSYDSYVLFEQKFKNNITLRDVTFITDNVGIDNIIISNDEYISSGLNFGSSVSNRLVNNKK